MTTQLNELPLPLSHSPMQLQAVTVPSISPPNQRKRILITPNLPEELNRKYIEQC